ncbi:hypothetical protein ACQKQD_32320 [Methylobacterium sp. NPDC080182]|uniref:hypothetical protein n=1 Tax=Methylobacterium sp. NPDC080182 TaxID=3390590 RepID=UPI003CFFDA94
MTGRGQGNAAGRTPINNGSTSIRLTRRGVLGGAASLAAGQVLAAPAASDLADYRLVYVDEGKRDEVALVDGSGTTLLNWQARTFGVQAYFAIERESVRVPRPSDLGEVENGKERGDVYRPKTWRLTVHRAALPSRKARTFTMRFVIDRRDVNAPWTIGLSSEGWWDGGEAVRFASMPLSSFLEGQVGAARGLVAKIDARRGNAILKGFFGPRIEASGGLRLTLARDLSWQVEPQDVREGGLYILHVFLTFRTLTVRRVFSKKDEVSWKEDPSLKKYSGRQDTSPPLLFDAEAPASVQGAKRSSEGLYGTVGSISATDAFPIVDRPAGRPPVMGFELGSLSDPGASLAASLRLSGIGPADLISCLQAALRHWGDPDETVAGCIYSGNGRGVGTVSVSTGENGRKQVEAAFTVSSLEIVRQYRADAAAIVTRFRFRPAAKEHHVETRLGGFVVAALPTLSPKPGRAPETAPIEVVTHDEGDTRRMRAFSARHGLYGAAIPLPERTGADPDGTDGQRHTARLDFEGAEVFFHIPRLAAPPPGSADALIPIGLPGRSPSAGEIALDRARLTVLRPVDLLALKFRFADLVLTLPWRGGAPSHPTLAPRGGRSSARAAQPHGQSAEIPARDGRPLLVVEFPPQHVFEQAYFRQRDEPVELPGITPADDKKKDFKTAVAILNRPRRWRGWPADGTVADDRIAARKRIQALPRQPGDATLAAILDEFLKTFAVRAQALGLPKEQRLYVGPGFLDPDARRLATELWRSLSKPTTPPEAKAPDVILTLDVRREVLKRAGIEKENDFCAPDETLPIAAQDALLVEKDRRDAAFADFRLRYGRLYGELIAPPSAPAPHAPNPAFSVYRGRAWYKKVRASIWPELATLVAQASSVMESIPEVTEARLSGPSRIAFRINPDDYQPERAGGGIPYSLEGLTDWGSMDMAVVRRAERLLQQPVEGRLPPRWQREIVLDNAAALAFQGLSRADRLTQAADAPAPGDPARPPSRVSAAVRLAEVHGASRAAPDLFETALELPARLFLSPAQTATWKTTSPGIRRALAALPPLSSAQAHPAGLPAAQPRALWTARLFEAGTAGGVRAIWSPDFRPEALLPRPAEDGPPEARAAGAPPRGPWKPWAIRRSLGGRSPAGDLAELDGQRFRNGLDANDRHELVVLSSVPGLPVVGRRGPKGELDRKGSQIDPPPGFRLADLRLETLDGTAGAPDTQRDYSAIYDPRELSVSELSLSALGGSLNLDTAFVPPASARRWNDTDLFDAFTVERWRQRTVLGRDVLVEVVYKGFLFPLGHGASLVKLTERTFVRVGDTPVAVQIQRMFLKVGDPVKAYPAHGQPNRARRWPCAGIEILTVTTPDLVDPTGDVPDSPSCGDPGAVTVVASGRLDFQGGSPGLCFWPRTASRDGAEVWFEMRVSGEAVPVRMPMIFADNRAINHAPTMKALVAYYNTEFKDGAATMSSPLRDGRTLDRRGQPVVMGLEKKPGDTTYETAWWRLKAEGREDLAVTGGDPFEINNTLYERTPLMVGQDQPPFYPLVERARCRLTQVERLTGQAPIWVETAYDPFYVREGFPDDPSFVTAGIGRNTPEAFLVVTSSVEKMTFAGRGNLSGSVAHPEMNIVAISRTYGPLSQNGDEPLSSSGVLPKKDTTVPAPVRSYSKPNGQNAFTTTPRLPQGEAPEASPCFFRDILPNNAKLLGIVPLSLILDIALDQIADKHPRLREVVDYGSREITEGAREARAILRDTVIQPILDLVKALQEKWAAIAVQRQGGEVSLAKAFPQIGSDLDTLGERLRKCLAAGTSDAAFMADLAEAHEAGRRLMRTIDTIAQDPLAAMSDEQLGALRDIKRRIDAIIAEANDIVAGWKAFPQTLLDALAARLMNAASDAMRRFVVTVPIPAVDSGVRDKVQDKVDEAVRKALWKTLYGEAEASASVSVRLDGLGQRLTAFPIIFADKLQDVLNAGGMTQEVKNALEALQSRLTNKTLAVAAKAIDAVLGGVPQSSLRSDLADSLLTPAMEPLLAAIGVKRLSEAPARIDAIVAVTKAGDSGDPVGFLNELATLVPPLAALLIEIERTPAIAKVKEACGQLRTALSQAADAFLPRDSDLDGIATCLGRIETFAGADACTLSPATSFSQEALKTLLFLREAEKLLPTPEDAAGIKKAREALQSVAGLLATALAELAALRRELGAALAASPKGCALPAIDGVADTKRLAAAQGILVRGVAAFATESGAAITVLRDRLLDPAATDAFRTKATKAMAALLDLTAGSMRAAIIATVRETTDPAVTATADALTTLADTLKPALPTVAADLTSAATMVQMAATAGTGTIDQAREVIKNSAERLKTAAAKIRSAKDDLQARVADALVALPEAVAALQEDLTLKVLDEVEGAVLDRLTRLAAQAEAQLDGLADNAATLLRPALEGLDTFYGAALARRAEIEASISKAESDSPITKALLDGVRSQLGVDSLLQVKRPGIGDPAKPDDDLLAYERGLIAKAADASAKNDGAGTLASLDALAKVWSADPALVTIVKRLGSIDASSLRFAVVRALDLKAFRDQIEDRLRELIPTRARLSYDLGGDLKAFPSSGKAFLEPGKGAKLTLGTRAEIDLLQLDKKPPTVTVVGEVGPFTLSLLPMFEAVKINFRGLTFTAASGRSPDFNVRFGGTEIGRDAQFLQQLQDYLSPKGGGLKVALSSNSPGIEASYGVNLGTFGVGALSFSNVVLFAGAVLPFDNKPAAFTISIGRPSAPFLISSTIFGGGGYLALTTESNGQFKSFECSFDYGGVAAFGFGPLSGQGQLTLGIYIRFGDNPQLGGTFMARGAASIACFGLSTSLFVRLKKDPGEKNGSLTGEATYSFSFSLGIHDITFSVNVSSDQGSSMGSKDVALSSDILPPFARVRWAKLGEESLGEPPAQTNKPHLRVEGPSRSRKAKAFRRYFDPELVPSQPI